MQEPHAAVSWIGSNSRLLQPPVNQPLPLEGLRSGDVHSS